MLNSSLGVRVLQELITPFAGDLLLCFVVAVQSRCLCTLVLYIPDTLV